MLLERSQLEGMKLGDLKRLTHEIAIEPSLPTETKEALINRLLVASAMEAKPENPTEEKKEPAKASCTIDQVKLALNPYILRGMKLFYDADSKSWLIRIQLKSHVVRDSNTGETRVIERWRDDSGTLNQPIEVIKRCARVLMQGAPTPEQVKPVFNPSDSYESVA